MDKLQQFTKLMDTLYETSDAINQYERKQRYYGTDIRRGLT